MRDLVAFLKPDCASGGKRTDTQCVFLARKHPGKPRWNGVEAARREHCECFYEQCGLSRIAYQERKRTDTQWAGFVGWHQGKPRWNAVEAAQRAHCEYLYEQCGLSPDCASGEQAK